MRLIDADDLLKNISSYIFDTTNSSMRRAEHIVKAHICDLIEGQPIAYNVDWVIEELRKIQYEDECYDVSLVVNLEDAEKIIKMGGCVRKEETYFTDQEYRLLLRALSREREVCEKVDRDCGEDYKLLKLMNSIEKKIKHINYHNS